MSRRTEKLHRLDALEPRRLFSAGLHASYFASTDLSGNAAVTRTDPTVDFDWANASPDAAVAQDAFSARWTGTLTPTTSGDYRFITRADDGVRLWIDGTPVIDRWSDRSLSADADGDGRVDSDDVARLAANFFKNGGAGRASGDANGDGRVDLADFSILASQFGQTVAPREDTSDTMHLDAGHAYAVRLEYYQHGGAASVKLMWTGPSIAKQLIPASVLNDGVGSPPHIDPPPNDPPHDPPPNDPPADVTYTPLVITHGGTYTGNFSSIKVRTTEPVILQDIRGNNPGGTLIDASGAVNLTVRRVTGSANGWFLDADGFASVTVENCTTTSGSDGILLENGANAATARVRYNNFTDIVGPYEHGNAVMIASTPHMSGAEIAWNRVVNHPGRSAVEDNINVYDSAGTAANPIRIHDNYVEGAYPADPTSNDFSGGGIICDYRAAFVRIDHNTVVNTTNYGVQISSGHDNSMTDNTVIFDEVVPATNVGVSGWDSYHLGSSVFYNNTATGNRAYTKNDNDFWFQGVANSGGVHLPATSAAAARAVWEATLAGATVGA
jgi:hypothetical protein